MRLASHMLILVLGLASLAFLAVLVYLCCRRRSGGQFLNDDLEKCELRDADEAEFEDLVTFHGGQDLTISDILEAPGEVIGKSNNGTLYKALLQRVNSVLLLRFLRPVCTDEVADFDDLVYLLGRIRHPNLVPLLGFYGGPRGEKLLVYPQYKLGNLKDFIRGGNGECHKWAIIYRIAIGIAKALDHLHSGSPNPLIHGNLKSKNILLGRNFHPHVSDFGLHLLLNPTAAHEMLEASAAQGYKAPELTKMKQVSQGTDVYSLGVILLELLTGREPLNEKASPDEDCYLPNSLRNAVLGHRMDELFHPDILVLSKKEKQPVEERVLKLFQLAMACCSPSPSLRPDIKQVLWRMEEMGR